MTAYRELLLLATLLGDRHAPLGNSDALLSEWIRRLLLSARNFLHGQVEDRWVEYAEESVLGLLWFNANSSDDPSTQQAIRRFLPSAPASFVTLEKRVQALLRDSSQDPGFMLELSAVCLALRSVPLQGSEEHHALLQQARAELVHRQRGENPFWPSAKPTGDPSLIATQDSAEFVIPSVLQLPLRPPAIIMLGVLVLAGIGLLLMTSLGLRIKQVKHDLTAIEQSGL